MEDYGAMMKKNGVFVNKDAGQFMDVYDMHVPDYVYHRGAPLSVYGNFYIYAGDGHLYGSWITVYKNELWMIHSLNVKRKYNVTKAFYTRRDGRDTVIKNPIRNVSDIYISMLDSKDFTGRHYMGFDIDNDHYEVIFGKGITNVYTEWKTRQHDQTFGFTEDEIAEINAWFE